MYTLSPLGVALLGYFSKSSPRETSYETGRIAMANGFFVSLSKRGSK